MRSEYHIGLSQFGAMRIIRIPSILILQSWGGRGFMRNSIHHVELIPWRYQSTHAKDRGFLDMDTNLLSLFLNLEAKISKPSTPPSAPEDSKHLRLKGTFSRVQTLTIANFHAWGVHCGLDLICFFFCFKTSSSSLMVDVNHCTMCSTKFWPGGLKSERSRVKVIAKLLWAPEYWSEN